MINEYVIVYVYNILAFLIQTGNIWSLDNMIGQIVMIVSILPSLCMG